MRQHRLVELLDDPRSFLADPDPAIRRLAVSACAARLDDPNVAAALEHRLDDDDDPRVRAEAAEVLAQAGGPAAALLHHAAADEGLVAEAAATGLGELEDASAVPWLMEAAADHSDPLVREAAVAALGAIGDPRAKELLIELSASAPPQVRRRAVVALTAFDGKHVELAIESAGADRNPMVREVAQMLLGRPLDDGTG